MLNLLDYQDLPIGETRQGKCPTCGMRKFYVTRKQDGFAYICFRATCSQPPGFTGYYGPAAPYQPEKSRPPVREYRGSINLVTYEDIDYFLKRFYVHVGDDPQQAAYWVKLAEDLRYVFPVWGRGDEDRGIVLRRPIWAGEVRPPRSDILGADFPKSINYFRQDVPPCGWYHSTDINTVVITEDPVSAMRVANIGFTAACIYGTNLQDEVILDLKKFGASEYVFALDPDATGKAIRCMTRLMAHVPHTRVAIMKHDPKDYELDIWLQKDLGL